MYRIIDYLISAQTKKLIQKLYFKRYKFIIFRDFFEFILIFYEFSLFVTIKYIDFKLRADMANDMTCMLMFRDVVAYEAAMCRAHCTQVAMLRCEKSVRRP